jgi:hypothetical protein
MTNLLHLSISVGDLNHPENVINVYVTNTYQNRRGGIDSGYNGATKGNRWSIGEAHVNLSSMQGGEDGNA